MSRLPHLAKLPVRKPVQANRNGVLMTVGANAAAVRRGAAAKYVKLARSYEPQFAARRPKAAASKPRAARPNPLLHRGLDGKMYYVTATGQPIPAAQAKLGLGQDGKHYVLHGGKLHPLGAPKRRAAAARNRAPVAVSRSAVIAHLRGEAKRLKAAGRVSDGWAYEEQAKRLSAMKNLPPWAPMLAVGALAAAPFVAVEREATRGAKRAVTKRKAAGVARVHENRGRAYREYTVPLSKVELDARGEKAMARYEEFQGAPPTRVRVYEYPDGKREVEEHVAFKLGVADITIDTIEDEHGREVKLPKPVNLGMVYSTDPRKSPNKPGGQYYHSFRESGGKPPIEAVDVETGILHRLGGTYQVKGWVTR